MFSISRISRTRNRREASPFSSVSQMNRPCRQAAAVMRSSVSSFAPLDARKKWLYVVPRDVRN